MDIDILWVVKMKKRKRDFTMMISFMTTLVITMKESGRARMTDNEIIKAFECCNNDGCENCPNRPTCCEIDVADEILNIINRQKAEIERLQNESIGNCEMAIAMRSDHNLDVDCNYCIDKAKSEAYREFAEKLKRYKAYVSGWDIYVVREHHIDNTLKELTEKNDKE